MIAKRFLMGRAMGIRGAAPAGPKSTLECDNHEGGPRMHGTLFIQAPPVLGNQFRDDAFLQSFLRASCRPPMLQRIEAELADLGALAGGELYRLQLNDRLNEPTLTQWDAWGNRVDRIEVTPLWRRAAEIAASSGLIAHRVRTQARSLLAHSSVRGRVPVSSLVRCLYLSAGDDGWRRTHADGVRQFSR